MGREMHRKTLGDYFTLQRGTTYKSKLLGEPGPFLLGLATIQRNGGFRSDSVQTYGGESPDKLLVQPGDLYVSLKDVTQSADLLGAVARLPLGHSVGRLTQDTVKLLPKGSDTPLDYLYWLMRTPQYRRYCRAHATGTTNLGLPREDFLAFPAPEPTPAQHTVVKALCALDDKIEVNRRINRTLEAMAQALFKHWFVDFGPFQDREFVQSELGPIPDGWKVTKLKESADFVKGVSYRRQDLQDSNTALVTLKSIARGGGYREDGLKPYIGKYKRLQQVHPGELVVAQTDLTQAAEVLGQVARVQAHPQFSTLVASLDLVIVRPKDGDMSAEFLFSLLSRDEFQDHAYGYANGTTVLHLGTSALPEYRFVLPPPNVISEFREIVSPMYQLTDRNEAQSRVLALTRDYLLPRLLSGEISAETAEEVVANTG
jgi:type I restriction enzyme, S subunit